MLKDETKSEGDANANSEVTTINIIIIHLPMYIE